MAAGLHLAASSLSLNGFQKSENRAQDSAGPAYRRTNLKMRLTLPGWPAIQGKRENQTAGDTMWKCKKCGEVLEDTFDSCWKCGTQDNGTSPRVPSSSISSAPSSPSEPPRPLKVKPGDKSLSVGLVLVGGGGLFWVFIRMTNLVGRLHTWSPPFDNYELTTLLGGVVALLSLAVGIRKLMGKPQNGTLAGCSSPNVPSTTASPPEALSTPAEAQKHSRQPSGIDFAKLSKFILILGIVVVCIGAYQALVNRPLPEPPADHGRFRGWNDFMSKTLDPTKNAPGVALLNMDRALLQTQAYKVVGFGAAIMFAGVAVRRSTKPERS